jgi:UDP-N-acetylmuramoyl-tripeptide--D-alanyl-D-alanine ligase
VQALPEDGVAILNYDDPWVRSMADLTPARVFFYGVSPEADLWADHVESLGLEGIRFRLHYQERGAARGADSSISGRKAPAEVLHVRVPMIGRHSVHTALRAAAVGLVEGLTWQEIVDGLHSQHTQLRLVAVRSERGALILDDTYNASPESTLAALNLLSEIDGHRIAVLGDMLELGPYEKQGHEMVGVRAAEVADELVTIGERGRLIAEAARSMHSSRLQVTELNDTQEAIDFLQQRLTEQDVVLVKGSHGMRMEQIVAALEVAS